VSPAEIQLDELSHSKLLDKTRKLSKPSLMELGRRDRKLISDKSAIAIDAANRSASNADDPESDSIPNSQRDHRTFGQRLDYAFRCLVE